MHKLSFDGVKFGLPGHVIHRFILEGSSLHFFDGKNYMKKKFDEFLDLYQEENVTHQSQTSEIQFGR